VVIDVLRREVIAEFQVYVRPEINPVLTEFCTNLTGITQDQVDGGLDFEEALKKAVEFLGEYELTDTNAHKTWAFVTCGDWDLRKMLPQQAQSRNVKLPIMFSQWINVKKSFEKLYKQKPGGMKGMLEILDLPLEGRHHSGIDDCRNIATVVRKILSEGFEFQLNGWNKKK
jgi:inhibitor of KinA sporulation pathway (predicted exonuclease)